VVIRFYTNAANDVDARFQQSFSKAQTEFFERGETRISSIAC